MQLVKADGAAGWLVCVTKELVSTSIRFAISEAGRSHVSLLGPLQDCEEVLYVVFELGRVHGDAIHLS